MLQVATFLRGEVRSRRNKFKKKQENVSTENVMYAKQL